MMRIATLLALATGLATGAAAADTAVIGASFARACFEAAARGPSPAQPLRDTLRPLRDALRLCDGALHEDALPLDQRVATYVNRGIIQMHAGQFAAAIADYDTAIRLGPDVAEAYVNKGIALMNWGNRTDQAVTMLSAGIDRGPLKPEVAYYSRGIANETLGRTREAYEDYSRAAQLAPGWADPVTELQRFQTVRRKTAGV